tara:strand:+ start:375 stop:740 length:366 start_codon:yes stop_codon:yes gene_type:complete
MYKDYEIKLNAILDKHGVQKIDLALMDDLVKIVKATRKFMNEAENKGLSSLKKVILKVENDFIKGYRSSSDGIDLIDKMKKQFKLLGIETPQEIKGYDNLLRSWQKLADDWIDQLNGDQYS